jgi:hypothetical protein
MVKLERIRLTCPVCGTTFESIAVVPNHAGEGENAALPEITSVADVLPFLVHVCRRCGYAGGGDAFGDDVEVTPAVRERVWAELAPTLARSMRLPWPFLTAPGSEKHEGAAKVAEWRGADALAIAELWIGAARCARGEGDHEAQRYFARRAARWFAEGLERDEVAAADRASMAYGLGELWYHIGDTPNATEWFERVAREVTDLTTQGPLMEAAARRARLLGGRGYD